MTRKMDTRIFDVMTGTNREGLNKMTDSNMAMRAVGMSDGAPSRDVIRGMTEGDMAMRAIGMNEEVSSWRCSTCGETMDELGGEPNFCQKCGARVGFRRIE